MLTIRGTNFEAAAEGGSAAVENAPELKITEGLSSFLGQEISKSDRPELTSAKVIISGGKMAPSLITQKHKITQINFRSRSEVGRKL